MPILNVEFLKKRPQLTINLMTIIISILFIYFGHRIVSNHLNIFNSQDNVPIVTARVESVLSAFSQWTELSGSEPVESKTIKFKAKILSGQYKGLSVLAIQQNDDFSPVKLKEVAKNDKIMLYETDTQESEITWALHEYVRTDALIALGVVFMIFLLLFGRSKGLNTIISLIFTCLSIFIVFIPSILSGFNIYLSSIIISLFIISSTLLLVNGFNKKSLSAGIGCLGGLAVSGILTFIMDLFLKLTGILDEESIYLLYIDPKNPIDLKAIIYASIIIGALGATLDVSVSIASSLNELRESVGHMTFKSMIQSGVNIGRDIIGTMSNTLILAYIGSSLSMALLLIAYNNSLLQLLNREMIVVEILQALVGSIGLLFTIPLTSVVYAFVYTDKHSSFQCEKE